MTPVPDTSCDLLADVSTPDGYRLYADLHEGEEDAEEYDDLPRRFVSALTDEGEPVGQLDYVFNPARPRVTFSGDIWVDEGHRRRGLATALVAALGVLHPGAEIDPGEFTEDGLAFWGTLGLR